ncbi:hypothetical protein [Ureaplasma canigenitalium]|uniref:hypothetical protein n=1 Tax=Ureaplasma canigenitalium TaxID=42092 RepID=UPI0004E1A78F|nr:hypothetical protein [Ureaplasma canigenitalium]
MLIKPQKQDEKIYRIKEITDDFIILENSVGDVKKIEPVEFVLHEIEPVVDHYIHLIKFDSHGGSVFEEYNQED